MKVLVPKDCQIIQINAAWPGCISNSVTRYELRAVAPAINNHLNAGDTHVPANIKICDRLAHKDRVTSVHKLDDSPLAPMMTAKA